MWQRSSNRTPKDNLTADQWEGLVTKNYFLINVTRYFCGSWPKNIIYFSIQREILWWRDHIFAEENITTTVIPSTVLTLFQFANLNNVLVNGVKENLF